MGIRDTSTAAGSTIAYICISSTMLIVNKAAIHALPFPFCVTNLQMIASVVGIWLARASGAIDFPNPDGEKLKSWIGVTIAWVLPILCNMKALQLLNVETVLVFRTMTVLGVAVGDAMWLKSSLSNSSILGLIVITLGGIIYGYYDVAYHATGYMWATAYWATMVANSLYIKMVFNQSKSMSTWEKSYLNNLMTVPILSLYCIYSENVPACIHALPELPERGLCIVLLSCVMGLAISVAGTRSREIFSATSFDVLGNMNKFISIGLSQVLLKSTAGHKSLAGLFVALLGGILYSPLGKKLAALICPPKEKVCDSPKFLAQNLA